MSSDVALMLWHLNQYIVLNNEVTTTDHLALNNEVTSTNHFVLINEVTSSAL